MALNSAAEGIDICLGQGWRKHQAVAIVAQGVWESGSLRRGQPLDWTIETSALGDKGTACGGWQWRGERYYGPLGLLPFTFNNFPGRSWADLDVQLAFVNWELGHTEKRCGDLLRAATNVEESTKAFIGYLRPHGFTWENPENGHGYVHRLELAQALMGESGV